MLAATRTVHLDRPPEIVFAALSDPANEPRWRDQVLTFAPTGPLARGTVVRQTIKGPGGRPIRSDLRLTAFDPPERYAFEVIAGPVRPVGEYLVTAAPGGTDLTFSLSAELRGLRALLLGRAVQRSMDGEMRALDRAKAILEA